MSQSRMIFFESVADECFDASLEPEWRAEERVQHAAVEAKHGVQGEEKFGVAQLLVRV